MKEEAEKVIVLLPVLELLKVKVILGMVAEQGNVQMPAPRVELASWDPGIWLYSTFNASGGPRVNGLSYSD